MKEVILGLGTNLSDREKNLRNAIADISREVGEIIKVSSVYETSPWGFKSGKYFLNLVLIIKTTLTPFIVLERILKIETLLGRRRGKKRYSSRIIDIDILLYRDQILNEPGLKIPHPLLHERKFVLVPLSELLPEGVHPILNKTFKRLLEECRDESEVKQYRIPYLRDNHNNPLSAKL